MIFSLLFSSTKLLLSIFLSTKSSIKIHIHVNQSKICVAGAVVDIVGNAIFLAIANLVLSIQTAISYLRG